VSTGSDEAPSVTNFLDRYVDVFLVVLVLADVVGKGGTVTSENAIVLPLAVRALLRTIAMPIEIVRIFIVVS
jgi:hypothetical protein